MANDGLCKTCVYSIWCPTWAEYKCVKMNLRFTSYGFSMPVNCNVYKKRDKDFEEPKCQCEDCLKNEDLWDEEDG